MFRKLWLGGLVVFLGVSGLLARQGVVTTNDGRVIRGDIQKNPDGTTNITFGGGTLTLDPGNISQIIYADDARTDFDTRMRQLDPSDIAGRIDLGRLELRAGQYDLAVLAAQEAQRLDPHNPDAQLLLDTIQAERLLSQKLAAAPPQSSAGQTAATAPSQGAYLTVDDVYAIRRAELSPDDDLRIDFANDVRKRYEGLQANPATFDSETPTQQALDIIQSGDPNLAKDVHIENDPAVIREYRAAIQPRILTGCAAAGCHNSDAEGGFMLYTDAKETLPAYTNYFILQVMARKLAGGGDTFGHGPVFRPMIDRARVDSSLLLQYGLPQSVAAMPHPNARGFKPMFHGVDDPVFQFVSRWIASLKAIRPDYGVDFQLPTTRGS